MQTVRPAYVRRFKNPQPDSNIEINPVLSLEEYCVSVEEKVFEIVSEHLGTPREEIARESAFIEDLKADSLDIVELVMEFEEEFDVTIPDEDYEKIRTVGDAIDYIEEHK